MATRSKIRAEKVARTIIVIAVLVVAVAVVYAIYKMFGLVADDFSGGGEVVIVPDTIGKTVEEAEGILKDRQLMWVIQRRHSDTQPTGRIFQQDPSPRAKTRQGQKVTLFESMGQATFVVPDLVGQDIKQIPKILRDSNLALGTITKILSPGIATGEIVYQQPKAGHELSTSTQVDLVVVDNDNIVNVTMPEVVGGELYPVEERLARLNLQIRKVIYIADDTVKGGTVISQSIDPDAEVPIGSKVELTVALPSSIAEKPVKTVKVHVPVPNGPQQQKVKIKVFDALGASVPYEASHAPGDRVDRGIDVEGPTKIYIFINDMNEPFREEIIP